MRSKIRCDVESCKILEFWRELNKGLIRIKLICHEQGYVKILDNVPIIFSFGNSNKPGAMLWC